MITQAEREAIATSGKQVFERLTTQGWRPEDDGKFVAIDVDSADFEIDSNDYSATERLRKRQPNARMWLARIGRKAAYQLRPAANKGTHVATLNSTTLLARRAETPASANHAAHVSG